MDVWNYGQMDIFDFLPKAMYTIDTPIRLIELFGGIGAQAMALRNIGANFEHYSLVEFDKYPVKSYNAIHGTDFKPMDITQTKGEDLGIVDTDMYTYIMTYSFPCQDLSVAGKMRGMVKGSGTRSGLLWEVERLLNEVTELPQVLLMENVPQVHSKNNMADFQKWIDFLTSKGYSSYWKDLNAKDYGVAQSRNRCFMVSILGDYYYEFPSPFPLEKRMKDYLEDEVDEKYYINSDKAKELIDKLILNGKILRTEQNRTEQLNCPSIIPDQSKSQTVSRQDTMQESAISSQMAPECVRSIGFIERGTGQHQSNMVYDPEGLMPAEYAVQCKEPMKVMECKRL